MAEQFKINDLVEVVNLKGDQGRDWIIVDIVNDGNKAIIRNLFSKARSIVLLSNLRHQKKEGEK